MPSAAKLAPDGCGASAVAMPSDFTSCGAASLSETSASFATIRSSLPPMLPIRYVGALYSPRGGPEASTFAVFSSTSCSTCLATWKYRSAGIMFPMP